MKTFFKMEKLNTYKHVKPYTNPCIIKDRAAKRINMYLHVYINK